ncbi:polyisoprenoid-binding protein YceI [Mucilaginibacter gracilis]|uniref:Polyisoprenoid-binding protein YceI n=1 Tax=Mucilaginibacter gracilis TaxID=423350 RepID=A0A495IX82_9SPHI|nr:YceI family protein [Mucilaginibacter gracilis]RKR80658.1 polyisoprenoid-binding protein YceI [Mucilaginibacter gracilis]
MKIVAIYITLFCLIGTAFGQTKHTVTKADVSYEIKNMGFKTSGIIGGFEATILFDKDHLPTSSITAAVNTATINSDNDMRDEHLRKPEYFDVEHYPKIMMKSVSFKGGSATNYTGTFDVTIKGQTKRVDVPFTYIVNGGTAVFKGSFKINRLDFAIGDKSMVLSNEVTISLNVETAIK